MKQLLTDLGQSMRDGTPFRAQLPGGGEFYLDRPLPFLLLHRTSDDAASDGLEPLVRTEAAFLVAPDNVSRGSRIRRLMRVVSEHAVETHGAFLLVDVWAGEPAGEGAGGLPPPGFHLHGYPENPEMDDLLDVLCSHLSEIRIGGVRATAQRVAAPVSRRIRDRLLSVAGPGRICRMGVEVAPCHRAPEGGEPFPGVMRVLRRGFSRALRHGLYHFTRQETRHCPADFHALGRRHVQRKAWQVDRELDGISSSFDLLSCLNPLRPETLWRAFQRSNFERLPPLRYAPIPIDIGRAKRQLFALSLERVEDPTLAHLFGEKQDELDRQLNLLKDRGTRRFVLGSILLYGNIPASLVRTAEELLERVPGNTTASRTRRVRSDELARRAREEVEHYRQVCPDIEVRVELSSTPLSGLLVNRDVLLVSTDQRPPRVRVDALIQHEVGTHLVTYHNGRLQPLRQLRAGLAGYEELQEGLAVLAEYLVGGLDALRLRTLAARVLAAKAVVDGASFIEIFRLLCRYGFTARSAFQITLRVFRGGGFVKDYIYLSGLQAVLNFLSAGGEMERLYIGKIALKHLGIIEELRAREVLRAAPLLPRFLERPECLDRLAFLRAPRRVYELATAGSA